MSSESPGGASTTTGRTFDLGLVQSSLEREAPTKNHALLRLTAALIAASISSLAVPGCNQNSVTPSAAPFGLDNGTVGKLVPVEAAPGAVTQEAPAKRVA